MNQLSDVTQSSDGAGPYFNSEDHFIGIARHIAKSRRNARVSLRGNGEIVISPSLGEFYAKVRDIAEFCQAPAADFEVVTLNDLKGDQLLSQVTSGKIRELLWTAAFHASRGCLDRYSSERDATHIYDVVSFTRWPNLTRLPVTSNTMRICALLTRHPTSIGLVARKLHIRPEEVYQVYSAANSYGIVNCLSCNAYGSELQHDEVLGERDDPVLKQRSLFQALFTKISGL
jgi:hypothetical protein